MWRSGVSDNVAASGSEGVYVDPPRFVIFVETCRQDGAESQTRPGMRVPMMPGTEIFEWAPDRPTMCQVQYLHDELSI